MPAYVSEALRARVAAADRGRCAYCLTSEAISGLPLTIDHIQPTSLGGETTFDNLCLACRSCNEFKANRKSGSDPLTGDRRHFFTRDARAGMTTLPGGSTALTLRE